MPTIEEVRAVYDRIAGDKRLTPKQIRQGVRTEVHWLLQQDRPAPHPLPSAAAGKTREDFQRRAEEVIGAGVEVDARLKALHDEEAQHHAERQFAMRASVPLEVHHAFYRDRVPGVVDPHHYAQRAHGIALWAQTDALVEQAIGKESV